MGGPTGIGHVVPAKAREFICRSSTLRFVL